MTETERRYAQIEKEALATTWACEKFSDFILGKRIQVETDHKPLVPLSHRGSSHFVFVSTVSTTTSNMSRGKSCTQQIRCPVHQYNQKSPLMITYRTLQNCSYIQPSLTYQQAVIA